MSINEVEAIIEFNRQRKKTTMQVFNETEALDEIYRKEAKEKLKESGRVGGESKSKGLASLPKASEIHTREQLSEVTGVPQKKLETIIELGKLAKTGKTKEERKHEEDIIT